MKVFIGIDFSCAKPALAVYKENACSLFCFPQEISKAQAAVYASIEGVNIINRSIGTVSHNLTEHELMLEHVQRSIVLNACILNVLDNFINKNDEVYIGSEGLSYGSTGQSFLDLAGYRHSFMCDLYRRYKDQIKAFKTYSPSTIKKFAGCSGKDARSKNCMIEQFFLKDFDYKNPLKELDDHILKTKKGGWLKCLDDYIDASWILALLLTLTEEEEDA